MALNPTNVIDNPATPGVAAELFIPDQLIAGPFQLITDVGTLLAGGPLPRGSVLGKITASGKYTLSLAAAGDGSQVPVAILADAADSTAGDVPIGVYLAGEFNANALNLGAGWTVPTITAALRSSTIFIKTIASDLSNVPPT